MVVVNLFAGPGVGKSTLAAEVFVALKKQGTRVELVTEYAKNMVYEKRGNILEDQLYILAKQNRRLHRLIGSTDVAVSDTSLLFALIYAPEHYFSQHFRNLTLEVFNGYKNRNFWLERSTSRTYQTEGRMQTFEEAKKVDVNIQNMLSHYSVPYVTIPESASPLEIILSSI